MMILNDQGGEVINISEDITATLRAQDHGHPPVVCFEPGIARREGSDSRFVNNTSVTLRAQMGDNQPAVCYEEKNEQPISEVIDEKCKDLHYRCNKQ